MLFDVLKDNSTYILTILYFNQNGKVNQKKKKYIYITQKYASYLLMKSSFFFNVRI